MNPEAPPPQNRHILGLPLTSRLIFLPSCAAALTPSPFRRRLRLSDNGGRKEDRAASAGNAPAPLAAQIGPGTAAQRGFLPSRVARVKNNPLDFTAGACTGGRRSGMRFGEQWPTMVEPFARNGLEPRLSWSGRMVMVLGFLGPRGSGSAGLEHDWSSGASHRVPLPQGSLVVLVAALALWSFLGVEAPAPSPNFPVFPFAPTAGPRRSSCSPAVPVLGFR